MRFSELCEELETSPSETRAIVAPMIDQGTLTYLLPVDAHLDAIIEAGTCDLVFLSKASSVPSIWTAPQQPETYPESHWEFLMAKLAAQAFL